MEDPELLHEMQEGGVGGEEESMIIVSFSLLPCICRIFCVNSCKYCGFRAENKDEVRHVLTMDEVRDEVAAVIDEGT